MEDALKLDPEARGKLLMNNSDFAGLHNEVAVEGQTEVLLLSRLFNYNSLLNKCFWDRTKRVLVSASAAGIARLFRAFLLWLCLTELELFETRTN